MDERVTEGSGGFIYLLSTLGGGASPTASFVDGAFLARGT